MGELLSALQEEQNQTEEAKELNKSLADKMLETKDLIETQMQRLSEQESEIKALKLELETCEKENNLKREILVHRRPDMTVTESHLLHSQENHQLIIQKENDDSLCNKDEYSFLKKELCESLKCLNQERRKYQEMKERLKLKLVLAKQKLEHETRWRDEKMEDLEKELFLCSFALTKEKELTTTVTMENDKLLVERKRLLQQQLNQELYNKKNSNSIFQCRIEDLEMENRKLHNKILDLSSQVLSMEGSLLNIQSLRAAQMLKDSDSHKILAQLPAQIVRSLPLDVASQSCSSQDSAETWSQCSSLARSGEMGYLNLNSSHNLSLHNTSDQQDFYKGQ